MTPEKIKKIKEFLSLPLNTANPELTQMKGYLEDTLADLEELSAPEPEGSCRLYMMNSGSTPKFLPKKEFDQHFKDNEFEDGPYRDNFGDGEYDPYSPNRQAFGKLKDGTFVFCELRKKKIK